MFRDHLDTFSDYLIEKSFLCDTYLIPGKILEKVLDWYGKERLKELICDGLLLCTPAGSTAYNLSAHGPILPLTSNLLALTPISAFRPRRWKGALLPRNAKVRINILEKKKRPVSVVADNSEFRDIEYVEISEDKDIQLRMLFDPKTNLEERIINEQFIY